MRAAVVDIGTNSTRLLIADVSRDSSEVVQLERRSTVTRLGDGVDSTGTLSQQAMQRVLTTLIDYCGTIAQYGCDANIALMTSAVRDASNGSSFTSEVKQLGLDAVVLSGDEEAELMFLGAMSDRPDSAARTVVIDIGGGSTEFVIGFDRRATFHRSVQAGVVRMSERHIHSDPPAEEEVDALSEDVLETFSAALPPQRREDVSAGIAVAGTATSAAAIALDLEPYDPNVVHGFVLSLPTIESLLARLSQLSERERRAVRGLHPDRAPTIVAGMVLLREALRIFSLDEVEVSEHDILRGGALRLAGVA